MLFVSPHRVKFNALKYLKLELVYNGIFFLIIIPSKGVATCIDGNLSKSNLCFLAILFSRVLLYFVWYILCKWNLFIKEFDLKVKFSLSHDLNNKQLCMLHWNFVVLSLTIPRSEVLLNKIAVFISYNKTI